MRVFAGSVFHERPGFTARFLCLGVVGHGATGARSPGPRGRCRVYLRAVECRSSGRVWKIRQRKKAGVDEMTFYDQKFGTPTRPLKAEAIVPKVSPPKPAAAPAPKPSLAAAITPKGRGTLAYGALLSFSFLYYARPEDFIPGMANIPAGKISGGLALVGLALSWGRLKGKMPLA